jgi:hypothetical protein
LEETSLSGKTIGLSWFCVKKVLWREKEDLGDLGAQLSEYSFCVKTLPGERNEFPDYLSRNSVDEIFPDHRLNDEKCVKVLHLGN